MTDSTLSWACIAWNNSYLFDDSPYTWLDSSFSLEGSGVHVALEDIGCASGVEVRPKLTLKEMFPDL